MNETEMAFSSDELESFHLPSPTLSPAHLPLRITRIRKRNRDREPLSESDKANREAHDQALLEAVQFVPCKHKRKGGWLDIVQR